MKKLIVVVVAVAALVPAAASAKERLDKAKVLYTPAPAGLKAGQAWNVSFHFFFHDGRPWLIDGLRPTLTIRNAATGATRAVPVVEQDETTYRARVRFPTAGRWRLTFDFGVGMGLKPRLLGTVNVA
jgi:hypothetical protein